MTTASEATGVRAEASSVAFVVCGPERLMGLSELTRTADEGLRGSAPAGRWLAAEGAGEGEAGGLGVLIDDVLGYTVNSLSTGWSVSTELSVDMVAPVPLTGRLHCTGRVLGVDDAGALVGGVVTDDAGRTVALATLRGRFLSDLDFVPAGSGSEVDRRAHHSLDSLLAPEVERIGGTPGVLRVRVEEKLTNPRGHLHGGMVFCVAELAAAAALPSPARTASVRVQLVRGAATGSVLTVHARPAHDGRTLGVVNVVITDEDERVCTTATVVRH